VVIGKGRALAASAVVGCALMGSGCLSELPNGLTGEGIPSSDDDGVVELAKTVVEPDSLDKEAAQEKFKSTTDLMHRIFAPTCAAENNECHNNEDFPDFSSEGSLWSQIDVPCNLGVGSRETIEDFCEVLGDELKIAHSFVARIGSITLITDAEGEFSHYEILIDKPLSQDFAQAEFVVMRDSVAKPQLGAGVSLSGSAGAQLVKVMDSEEIGAPTLVLQGDENKNGKYGDGSGVLIKPGDARNSYLVRRLFGEGSNRVRMPINDNADNPTEVNQTLSLEEMYAVTSWINCLESDDNVYSDIRYDCNANLDNHGAW